MVYDPNPPYEILQNRLIDFATMHRLRRFARYWDLVGNSGNFVESTRLLWANEASPFKAFLQWSDWLHAHVGRTDSIALLRLMRLLFEFLITERKLNPQLVAASLWRDYRRGGRHDKPGFLQDHLEEIPGPVESVPERAKLPKRQARHVRSSEKAKVAEAVNQANMLA